MILNKKQIKRLGVFVFYDKDGIVDDYVLFMLNSLKEATEDIIIVSNSEISATEKKKLNSFTDKIKIRQNIGLDAGAFKEVFDEYQEYFKEFDELILLNDTFYGPFTSFKKICQSMEKKDIDFWGLTANYDSVDGYGDLPDKMIHSHIQTFFIVFRNNVLKSSAFIKYWERYNIKKMQSFLDVVTKHEIAFTYYLEQVGFKWDTYTNLENYHSENIKENYNVYAYDSYNLIKKYNCPFIKRKNFVFEKKDVMYLTNGSDAKKSLDYIQSNKLYDINMIWKNLVRIYKPEELYFGLNLNFIVKEKKNTEKTYVLLFILENERYLKYYQEFFKTTDIKHFYVISSNKKIKIELAKIGIEVISKQKCNIKKFEYIGIIKDTYFHNLEIPLAYENNWNALKTNGFNSQNYIYGLLELFAKNEHIGLFIMPPSVLGEYFDNYAHKETIIPANENGCWLKRELLDWSIIEQENFIQEYIKKINEENKMIGKILNEKEVENYLTNQDYIIYQTYQNLKKHHLSITTTFNDALYNISHTVCIVPGNNKIRSFIIKILKKLKLYDFLKKLRDKLRK